MLRRAGRLGVGLWLVAASPLAAQQGGRAAFESRCARCHGADGAGGERGPDILHSRTARARSEQGLREVIRTGIPAAGMPAFALPDAELQALAAYVRALIAPASAHPALGNVAAGERFFVDQGRCASCHMVRGRGGLGGPDLSDLARQRTRVEIEQKITATTTSVTPGYQKRSVPLRDGREARVFLRTHDRYEHD